MNAQSVTAKIVDLSAVTTAAEARIIVREHLTPALGGRYAPVYVWRENGTTHAQPEPVRYSAAVESILRHASHWDLEVSPADPTN